jgi:hypothetical protein
MPELQTFKEVVAHNESLPCEIPGCNRRRHSLSKICRPHMAKRFRYGHALGGPTRLKDYSKTWLTEAKRLVVKNQNGASLQAFADWMRANVELAAREPHKVPAARYWAAMEQADWRDVLAIIVGTYLYERFERPFQLKDETCLWFAISFLSILSWHPTNQQLFGKTKNGERRELAEYMRRHLWALCEAFVKAIEAENAARDKHNLTMSQQLEVDDPIEMIEREAGERAKFEKRREISLRRWGKLPKEGGEPDAEGNPQETLTIEAGTGSQE